MRNNGMIRETQIKIPHPKKGRLALLTMRAFDIVFIHFGLTLKIAAEIACLSYVKKG